MTVFDALGDIIFREVTTEPKNCICIARHHKQHVSLYKQDSHHILWNKAHTDTEPAIGVLVQDVESILEEAWQQEGVDVFDGGAVGSLQLHIPAIRMKDGPLTYLIPPERRDDFFAIDFVAMEVSA